MGQLVACEGSIDHGSDGVGQVLDGVVIKFKFVQDGLSLLGIEDVVFPGFTEHE
jgi:hypothetical protein